MFGPQSAQLPALAADAHSFVINRVAAGFIALGSILLLLLVAQLLIRTHQSTGASGETEPTAVQFRRRGVKALVIGADGRASTSKLQAVMWTLAVLFAFVFLLVWGRSTSCGDSNKKMGPRCTEAAEGRTAFDKAVNAPLQAEYYVLLGFPIAAAVAAKALTTNKVTTGELTKSPIGDEASTGVGQGLSEIVSNDKGETDLLDFQYFAFNLLALAFFFIQFLTHPDNGLPDLPATLIALSGFSAAAYTTKQALRTDVRPAITSVVPQRIRLANDTTVTVVGTGFGQPPADAAGTEQPKVLLEGVELPNVVWTSDTRLGAGLDVDQLPPTAPGSSTSAQLTVMGTEGSVSEPFAVELYMT
jgi:IPT/TIG domain